MLSFLVTKITAKAEEVSLAEELFSTVRVGSSVELYQPSLAETLFSLALSEQVAVAV